MELALRDVIAARGAVARHLQPTPLRRYGGLSDLVGADVWVKHENHLPTGAFKVRGGVNLAARLSEDARARGLYTASTGNHGQSIAFAGRLAGTPVTIAVPEGANPVKLAAMRELGAEIRVHGEDFDQAREWIEGVAREKGGRFVGPTDPELIAGVGTYALEILEELPDVDAIFVPVGAGSGACGVCLVAKTLDPRIEVIAVQSRAAPAVQRSWRARRPVAAEMATRSEGLATRVSHANAMRMLGDAQSGLDDFVLVDEAEIDAAIVHLIDHTRNLAEGAGAAALAGAIAQRERLRGRKVVVVLSGGNLARAELARILRERSD